MSGMSFSAAPSREAEFDQTKNASRGRRLVRRFRCQVMSSGHNEGCRPILVCGIIFLNAMVVIVDMRHP
jgi:hypothetical protein